VQICSQYRMSIEKKIQALCHSVHRLQEVSRDQDMQRKIEGENPWFVGRFVDQAIENLRSQWLNEQVLQEIVAHYHLNSPINKRLALIFAGNIPLSGMHDFICGYLTGCHIQIKLSSKDRQLWGLFFHEMQQMDDTFTGQIQVVEKVKDFDTIIATGSDTTFPYFAHYFSAYSNILRRNRNSLAVLRGDESEEQLQALADDILLYFGLGCRNVSHILIPHDFPPESLLPHFSRYSWLHQHTRYMNNYDYQRTLLMMNQVPHVANEQVILTENANIPSPISVLYFSRYHSSDEIIQYYSTNKDKIQCVVSAYSLEGIPTTKPGLAQQPHWNDYADGIDTIQFLLS
jgi:hypothetical protein